MDTIARPFGILLLFLYNITHNYLLAIIIFTILVKLMLMPFQMKSKKGMMRQQMLQPQLQELQKKHAGNQQKLSEEMQKLYREAGVSPMSGCLWAMLPLPIMIALYQAIRKPLTVMMGVGRDLISEGGAIYTKLSELGYTGNLSQLMNDQIAATKFIHDHFESFEGIPRLQRMSFDVFGLDLSAIPDFRIWQFNFSDSKVWVPQVLLFLIPVLAAFFMWLSTKVSTIMQKNLPGSDPEQAEKVNNSPMMLILGPGMSLWFAFILPAAMGVYWIVNTIVSSLSDIFLTKLYEKTMLADFAEQEARRKAREAEMEAKRQEAERRRAENAELQTDNTSKRKQQQKKKQEQAKRDLEWRRAHGEIPEPEYEPSRVGNRRYARGRSYDPDRFAFNGIAGAVSDTSKIDEDIAGIEDKLERAAQEGSAGVDEPAGDGGSEE